MQLLHGGPAGASLAAPCRQDYLTAREQGAQYRSTLKTEETEMSVFSTNRTETVRFGGLFGALVSAFTAWNDARVTRNALSRLSDRELDDIGLTRADIDSITAN
jgi:uncharacterized protein YjiS (DUF1127 family)